MTTMTAPATPSVPAQAHEDLLEHLTRMFGGLRHAVAVAEASALSDVAALLSRAQAAVLDAHAATRHAGRAVGRS